VAIVGKDRQLSAENNIKGFGKARREARHAQRWRERRIARALKSADPEGSLRGLVESYEKISSEVEQRQGHRSGNLWGHLTAFQVALENYIEQQRTKNG
jgi:hypothetical protein